MKIDILGVQINAETKAEILRDINQRLKSGQSTFIVTPYSESIVAAQKDSEFRNILNSADIALPDGIGILWAAKYLKIKNQESRIKNLWNLIKSLAAIIFYSKYIRGPISEKISGSEFIWDLARLAAENNFSIFLLGGFGDTPVLAAENLKSQISNLKIAGAYGPMLADCHCEESVRLRRTETKQSQHPGDCFASLAMTEKINTSKADFLFVALGPIRQEKWIAQNLKDLKIRLAIGLGGTFDYLAGIRPYRPKFWALRGLEWLWRLLTQPWRAFRILKGVFGLIWYCFKAKL